MEEVPTTSQHRYKLRGRKYSSSMNEDCVQNCMNKKIKLQDDAEQMNLKEPSLIGVTTIAAITTDTGEVVTLPPETLNIILLNLERKDLLQCRIVNSIWRSFTRSILLSQDYTIHLNEWKDSLTEILTKFATINKCLENAKGLNSLDQFPCSRFKLTGIDVGEKVVQNFFSLYGPFITTLTLSECRSQPKKDGQLITVSRLLTRQAPNIEELSISRFDVRLPRKQYDGPVFLFSPNGNNIIKLPALKRLETNFIGYTINLVHRHRVNIVHLNGILEEMLEVADNLESLKMDKFLDKSVLDKLVSLNKVHVVKSVNVQFHVTPMELLENLANIRPNLQHLRLELDELHLKEDNLNYLKQGTSVVQQIFESSSNTLETIEGMSPLGFLPYFRLPVLSQLKEMKISNSYGPQDAFMMKSVFPPGLDLATVFPNVKMVDLSLGLEDSDYDFWTTFFPHINPMDNTWPSVRTLKLKSVPPDALYNISRVFPNLQNLFLNDTHDFQVTCREIFATMKQLEFLQFDGVPCKPENKYPALDCALSGFSRRTCLKLSRSKRTLETVKIEELRDDLSIVELKDLKTLKILNLEGFCSVIMSRVCATFVFKLMPQLKVFLSVTDHDMERAELALSKVAPFVHSATIVPAPRPPLYGVLVYR